MNNWATRIKSRMKELGMTQEIVANKMGITRGAITHYLAGRRVPPLRQFQKLAAILKADPAWLQFGTTSEGNHSTKKQTNKNAKIGATPDRVPVLSWEQVSEFIGSAKIVHERIKEWLPNYHLDQPRWYALRIHSDAMMAPLGNNRSFHTGDMIIVDPDKTATHGNYVVAILPGSKEATFKQYMIDGGIRYLKPLNPQYPIVQIDDSTHVCGVVVGCVVQF